MHSRGKQRGLAGTPRQLPSYRLASQSCLGIERGSSVGGTSYRGSSNEEFPVGGEPAPSLCPSTLQEGRLLAHSVFFVYQGAKAASRLTICRSKPGRVGYCAYRRRLTTVCVGFISFPGLLFFVPHIYTDGMPAHPGGVIVIRSATALVHGLDWKGRPSLDPQSLWSLNVAFSPSKKTAFIKLRISIQLQTSTGDKEHHFYIFLPPERIASMTAEADADNSSRVHLRLMLKERGGLISPVRSPKPSNEHGEQLLASAQWLAARPGLSIEVPPLVSLPLSHWQHFCTACADGLVTADPDHTDVDHLYFGRGGHVMNSKAGRRIAAGI